MFCMTLKLLQNSTGNARILPRFSDKQLQLKVSFTFLSQLISHTIYFQQNTVQLNTSTSEGQHKHVSGVNMPWCV